jgi:hypothetical protein
MRVAKIFGENKFIGTVFAMKRDGRERRELQREAAN